MKINPNSWHARIYSWSYWFSFDNAPTITDLCTYMRRLMFVAPFMLLFRAFLYAMFTVAAIPAWIIGWYPTYQLDAEKGYWSKQPPTFKRYEGFSIGTWVIYPWYVLVPMIILAIHGGMIYNHCWAVLIGEGIAFLIVGLIVGVIYWSEHTTISIPNYPSIFGEYFHAKTQRFCPMVEIVDPSTSVAEPTNEVSPLSSALPKEEQDGGETL